jgi:hypothetical protein
MARLSLIPRHQSAFDVPFGQGISMNLKNFMQPFAASAVLCIALGSTVANAGALLTLDPAGDSLAVPATNDVLGGGFGTLQNKATLKTTADNVTLEYFFWGSESGFNNKLVTPFGMHTEINSTPAFPGFGSPLFSGTQADAGVVDLSFLVKGKASHEVTNAAGSIMLDGFAASIAWAFLTEDGKFSAEATDIALFTLDDSGASANGDFDDYVGYVRATTPVPVPAAVWMFGSALLGAGFLSRRQKQA